MARCKRWTHQDTWLLRELAARGAPARAIGFLLGRSAVHLRQRAARHGIVMPSAAGRERHRWTEADDALMRALFPTHISADVAKIIGVTTKACHARAQLLKLNKVPGHAACVTRERWKEKRLEAARATQFKPGQISWNRGSKGVSGTHPNSVKNRFQPDQPPQLCWNYKPIGSLRVTANGQLERKVTDDRNIVPTLRWTPVSRLVWEEHHGPIPAGHVVRFKSGMRTTVLEEITIDKLECLSRVKHLEHNSIHNLPTELRQVIQLKGALMRKIRNRNKESDT